MKKSQKGFAALEVLLVVVAVVIGVVAVKMIEAADYDAVVLNRDACSSVRRQ